MFNRDLKFLDKSNWSEIRRGWMYEAAIPFVGKRPLDFFIPDPNDQYRGTVIGKNGDFRPSEIQQVVVRLKPRKVVVVSQDKNNSNNAIHNITVAPISSIEPEEREKDWYKLAVEGTHPFFVYLPEEVTGKECFVNVSSITTIHKNLLLNSKIDLSEYMPSVDDKLEYYLSLGAYKILSESEEDVG